MNRQTRHRCEQAEAVSQYCKSESNFMSMGLNASEPHHCQTVVRNGGSFARYLFHEFMFVGVTHVRVTFTLSILWFTQQEAHGPWRSAWRNQLGKWPKFQKLHIYPLSTPGGRNWGYFCSKGSGFQDTGPFSKLPHLGMKLGKWPKFHKLHIYSLSTPGGRNGAYFCSVGQQFPRCRPIFQIVIFGHETWQVANLPGVAHI